MTDGNVAAPRANGNGNVGGPKADGKVDGSKVEDKYDRWMSSMKTMLGSLRNQHVKASSISSVPEQLRKSKEKAYMPKVVSIGPLHYRTRRDLLYMEDIKWHCMRSLLYRTGDAEESLTRCSKAMYALDEVVRASYADDIRFNSYDLAKIMLLDGCFLLELLICNDRELNVDLKSHFPGPGAEVGKTEVVLSDLTVLENQIPLLILYVLFLLLFTEVPKDKPLFANDSSKEYDLVRAIVNNLALSLFGYSSYVIPEDTSNWNPPPILKYPWAHFLELMKSAKSLTGKEEETLPESNHLSIYVERNFRQQPKLRSCAARLKAARVAIVPLYSEASPAHRKLVEKFGCDIKFGDRLLEIQPLHITETTEVMWRNFIAWEQNRTTNQNLLGLKTNCKFSEYALLFKGLICCEHDIQLLKDQKILPVNEAEVSNEDLLTFFRTIADGIEIDENSDFARLLCKLNLYSGARGNPRIIWHYCRSAQASAKYRCRRLYRELIRDHMPTVWKTIGVIAAIVLLGLTIAQTVFAAKSS